MTVTMGMEMAMAIGRFLQFTETNGRGELSSRGGDGLGGGVEEERRSEGVCHLICLGTSDPTNQAA